MTWGLEEWSRKPMGYVALYFGSLIFLGAIVAGMLLSEFTGHRWIPQLGPFQVVFLSVLLFILGMVRFLDREVFTPEDDEED